MRDVAALSRAISERLATLRERNTPAVRTVRRHFSAQLREAAATEVIRLALQLLKVPGWEHRVVAYELVRHHPPARAAVGEKELAQFGAGMDCWGAVDCFACYLAGPAWRAGQIDSQVVHDWARSADRWWRRAALVSTVPLNNKSQGGRGDAALTLAVCRMLLADRDDMVVKAMSWALRELAKRDHASVRAFLAEHAMRLAPRVLREVGNKLTTGRKNPRRASASSAPRPARRSSTKVHRS
jgi:3-methyladenine DNA glycosylase AlkD